MASVDPIKLGVPFAGPRHGCLELDRQAQDHACQSIDLAEDVQAQLHLEHRSTLKHLKDRHGNDVLPSDRLGQLPAGFASLGAPPRETIRFTRLVRAATTPYAFVIQAIAALQDTVKALLIPMDEQAQHIIKLEVVI